MTEVVNHNTNNALATVEFFASNELLNDPVTRRDYFSQLEGRDFIDLLQQTAHVIRTGDADAKQYFDGEKVLLHTFEVPDQQDKEPLLYETWDAARQILQNNMLEDGDALEQAAAIVSGGVLYAHPFIDGNGRTSRALSYVLARGTQDPTQFEKIIAESDVRGGWSNTPMGIHWDKESSYNGEQPQKIKWDFALSGEGEDAVGGVLANSLHGDKVLREFIERHGSDCNADLQAAMTQNTDGSTVLNAQQFIENIVKKESGGIANAEELLAIKREKSTAVVAGYLSRMVSQAPVPIFGRLQTAIDSFSRREDGRGPAVRKLVSEYTEKHAIDGNMTTSEQQVLFNKIYSVVDLAENGFVQKPRKLG